MVDPGVGTARKAIAVRTESYCFVAPDNGLLWETLREQKIVAMRELPVPADASRTFHGRDVFARAAARIDLGQFDELGAEIETIGKFALRREGREGIVVRIDRFGNIVTNLSPLDKDKYTVTLEGQQQTMPFFPTYDAAPDNKLFLITGSSNTLEISLKNSNANEQLGTEPGEQIIISREASLSTAHLCHAQPCEAERRIQAQMRNCRSASQPTEQTKLTVGS